MAGARVERRKTYGEGDDVVLPGMLGQMDILPGHLPLLTLLDIGQMTARLNGVERHFLINRGYAEILSDRVTVLTEHCEGGHEIDVENAREALKLAEAEVLRLEELSKTEAVEQDLFESFLSQHKGQFVASLPTLLRDATIRGSTDQSRLK